MITKTKPNLIGKRALWLVLRIYAGVCTFIVTAYLALILWSAFFRATPFPAAVVSRESFIKASYSEYAAKEFPNRAHYFYQLAAALGDHSREASVPVPATDLFKYLGKPDLIAGTKETGSLVYLYQRPDTTNRWAIFASVKDGKLTQIGYNDARATLSDPPYQAYPTQ